jgi:hypothetical protein
MRVRVIRRAGVHQTRFFILARRFLSLRRVRRSAGSRFPPPGLEMLLPSPALETERPTVVRSVVETLGG